ncbi:MAG: adenylate/guanylate cyclase domain-containing protein [Sneathiella sp.]
MTVSKIMTKFETPKTADVSSVVDWLIEGAPGAPLSQDILLHLVRRLLSCGLPLHRAAVFVTTLHPNVMGRAFYWHEAKPDIEVGEAPYAILDSEEYKQSPVVKVIENGIEIHRPLFKSDCPNDFEMLQGFVEEGITDYIILPLKFTSGEVHAVSWSTCAEEGFSEQHLSFLRKICPALSRLAEIMALKRVSINLLDAYLGHQSGEKVLSGKIKRGDGEDILAVIWFCDLRGSTILADTLPREEYMNLLNDYFECMAGAILDCGGEVLKYIGDAVLGIFPIDRNSKNYNQTCTLSVNAAREAMSRMEKLNQERATQGNPELHYGIGLHLGEVMYGNIGTSERIEFGVVGAAVNETSRIEGMTKLLEKNILVSGEVARHLDEEWHSLGQHSLRGVDEKIELFIPPSALKSPKKLSV